MTTDVTIVVPTRERPEYLAVALCSILGSAAEAVLHGASTRVLVVDDASPTDSTRKLAASLGVDYHRIEVHDGRNNPASAIATGVGLVDSTFYSVFGDDDVMLPRFINAHLAALAEGYDVCSTAFQRTDADLRPTREVILPEANIGDLLAGKITINDGAMTRTELIRDMIWDPGLEQAIFYPIWLDLLYRKARFTRLAEPTFLYRRHPENVSDHLGNHDAAVRQSIQERYRALVMERDGMIPAPTTTATNWPASPRAPRPWYRVAISRARTAFRRR